MELNLAESVLWIGYIAFVIAAIILVRRLERASEDRSVHIVLDEFGTKKERDDAFADGSSVSAFCHETGDIQRLTENGIECFGHFSTLDTLVVMFTGRTYNFRGWDGWECVKEDATLCGGMRYQEHSGNIEAFVNGQWMLIVGARLSDLPRRATAFRTA